MVLMMVNLFTLIKYAGHVEATEKITPGNEPLTGEGWDKLDIERSAAQPAIICFYGIGTVGYIAYRMAYLRIRMAACLLLHDGVAVTLHPYYIRHDALS